jgi:heme-degrading monooxygenase HmoA
VERFAESRGHVQGFAGFVSMEVLKSDAEDDVLAVARWQDKGSFDAWVGSEEFLRALCGRTAEAARCSCCAGTRR